MLNSQKEFLLLFGWDDFFESQITDLVSCSLFPARVICEERNLYGVQSDVDQYFLSAVKGKMHFKAAGRADYPAVGDWVLVERPTESDRGIIHHVLKRRSILQRKQIGSSADMQILATNVDYAFITSSVDADLNFRRIERYLAVVRQSNVIPIILLTKADTAREIFSVIAQVKQVFPDVEVHAVSKDEFEKANFLETHVHKGTTSVFMGSSGVGKSTLVNYLIGDETIKTQDVRQYDGKGRHTTTSRNLYVSRFGGLIIDTPGMRELQLSDHAEGVMTQFSDIDSWIQSCRFRDCRHETEPNCAILNALESENLSYERWNSYLKLKAEVRHGLRRQNKVLAAEDRKLWKKRCIDARHRTQLKKGCRFEE